ncbi:MAG: DUF4129 domain-containing protein [Armatimonadota bacterium]
MNSGNPEEHDGVITRYFPTLAVMAIALPGLYLVALLAAGEQGMFLVEFLIALTLAVLALRGTIARDQKFTWIVAITFNVCLPLVVLLMAIKLGSDAALHGIMLFLFCGGAWLPSLMVMESVGGALKLLDLRGRRLPTDAPKPTFSRVTIIFVLLAGTLMFLYGEAIARDTNTPGPLPFALPFYLVIGCLLSLAKLVQKTHETPQQPIVLEGDFVRKWVNGLLLVLLLSALLGLLLPKHPLRQLSEWWDKHVPKTRISGLRNVENPPPPPQRRPDQNTPRPPVRPPQQHTNPTTPPNNVQPPRQPNTQPPTPGNTPPSSGNANNTPGSNRQTPAGGQTGATPGQSPPGTHNPSPGGTPGAKPPSTQPSLGSGNTSPTDTPPANTPSRTTPAGNGGQPVPPSTAPGSKPQSGNQGSPPTSTAPNGTAGTQGRNGGTTSQPNNTSTGTWQSPTGTQTPSPVQTPGSAPGRQPVLTPGPGGQQPSTGTSPAAGGQQSSTGASPGAGGEKPSTGTSPGSGGQPPSSGSSGKAGTGKGMQPGGQTPGNGNKPGANGAGKNSTPAPGSQPGQPGGEKQEPGSIDKWMRQVANGAINTAKKVAVSGEKNPPAGINPAAPPTTGQSGDKQPNAGQPGAKQPGTGQPGAKQKQDTPSREDVRNNWKALKDLLNGNSLRILKLLLALLALLLAILLLALFLRRRTLKKVKSLVVQAAGAPMRAKQQRDWRETEIQRLMRETDPFADPFGSFAGASAHEIAIATYRTFIAYLWLQGYERKATQTEYDFAQWLTQSTPLHEPSVWTITQACARGEYARTPFTVEELASLHTALQRIMVDTNTTVPLETRDRKTHQYRRQQAEQEFARQSNRPAAPVPEAADETAPAGEAMGGK